MRAKEAVEWRAVCAALVLWLPPTNHTSRDASAPSGILLEKEVDGREIHVRDESGDRTLVRFGTGDEVTVTAVPAHACAHLVPVHIAVSVTSPV